MAELPASVGSLFWDIDIRTLDPEKHVRYVLERVMEYGDTGAVEWLLSLSPREQLRAVIRRSRSLPSKSRRFWELFLGKEPIQ